MRSKWFSALKLVVLSNLIFLNVQGFHCQPLPIILASQTQSVMLVGITNWYLSYYFNLLS